MAYFTASCDTVALNTKFSKKLKLDYPILSDPGRKTAAKFGVVDDKRRFPRRWTFIIHKGKVVHIDKKVKVTSHGEDIVKQLKELGAK